jgi:hypothetical protein
MQEREPYPTEDPREKATGDQYPEESPAETAPREDEHAGASDSGEAPSTSHEQEGDPGQATGNPRH